jgi:type I restriction enzyme M protein
MIVRIVIQLDACDDGRILSMAEVVFRRMCRVVLAENGNAKGTPVPDTDLRDTENVPLSEDVTTYFQREVLPHAPDAWIDEEKTKVGNEVPFNRHFYVFKPSHALSEIDADLKVVTDRILTMIGDLSR